MSDDERGMTLTELYKNLQKLIAESTHEIKSEISNIHSKIQRIETEVNNFQNKQKTNCERITNLEKKLRRNNLIIFGLEEDDSEDLPNKVLHFFNIVLRTKIDLSDIDCVFRVGRNNKPRPTLVKFVTLHKKSSVLKQGVLLKNTKIAISNDLTKEERNDQKILREHLKIARNANVEAKIIRNKLHVNDTSFTVKQLTASDKEGINTESLPSYGLSQNGSKTTAKTTAKIQKDFQVRNRRTSEDNNLLTYVNPPTEELNETTQHKDPNTSLPHSNFLSCITRSKRMLESSATQRKKQ